MGILSTFFLVIDIWIAASTYTFSICLYTSRPVFTPLRIRSTLFEKPSREIVERSRCFKPLERPLLVLRFLVVALFVVLFSCLCASPPVTRVPGNRPIYAHVIIIAVHSCFRLLHAFCTRPFLCIDTPQRDIRIYCGRFPMCMSLSF